MAVHQTRSYFLEKYGCIVDNKEIGKELREKYWISGNSINFLNLVENMTGKGLTGDAWISSLEQDMDEKVASEKKVRRNEWFQCSYTFIVGL